LFKIPPVIAYSTLKNMKHCSYPILMHVSRQGLLLI
jgi:hypothetical protein